MNGNCEGTPIPEEADPLGSVETNLASVLDPIKSVLRTAFGDGAPDLGLTITMEDEKVFICCEERQEERVETFKSKGSVKASVSAGPFKFFRFPAPFGLGTVDLEASFSGGLSAELSILFQDCEGISMGAGSLKADASGSVGLVLDVLGVGLANFSFSGSTGFSGGANLGYAPGMILATPFGQFDGVKVTFKFELLNGAATFSSSDILIPPSPLFDNPTTLTIPYNP